MKFFKKILYYCKFFRKYIRNANVRKGFRGEQAATKYLKKLNYRILERNWISGAYEIDIVAEKNKCLVFIEVKGRLNTNLKSGYDFVDKRKKQALRHAIKNYLWMHSKYLCYRFDIIAISWTPSGKICSVNHYENVPLR